MKVLLADDSGTMRMILRRALEKLQIRDVVEAKDGQEALELFQQHSVDLVLTDWNMPRMSGLEFVGTLRQHNRQVPILMITTEAERDRVLNALQHGVSDYLLKPFDSPTLEEKLVKWIGRLGGWPGAYSSRATMATVSAR